MKAPSAHLAALAWLVLVLAQEPQQQSVLRLRPVADPVDSPSRRSPAFPHRPSHRPGGFIALGDSYSAGIGTGFNGTENDCKQGFHAYPILINHDLVAAEGPNRTEFQFLSCTGSTIDELLSGSDRSQIDDFNITHAADFALLSIGGNDLGFFDIMNSCIFRFYSFYSGTCEAALLKSAAALASPDFTIRLRLAIMEILDRVRWERRPWFTIAVTGYARFFNAHTDECDDCSFGVWWRGPKLRKELRQRMNDMVLDVNTRIKHAVDAINADFTTPKVLFVDYDAAFEGHRFCEPTVHEPDYARNDTWFFLVGGQDSGDELSPNATEPAFALLPPESPLVDPVTCMAPAQRSGDWGQLALCMMAEAAWMDPTLRTADGEFVAQDAMWHVPTYYAKAFHPRTRGHEVIRDHVYKVWDEMQALEES